MPNIEIWGFPTNFLNPIENSRVEVVVNAVEKVLQDLGLATISVTTIVPSLTRLADGSKKSAPFLRVIVPIEERHLLGKLVPALREALPDLEVEDSFINQYYRSLNDEMAEQKATPPSPTPTEETSGC